MQSPDGLTLFEVIALMPGHNERTIARVLQFCVQFGYLDECERRYKRPPTLTAYFIDRSMSAMHLSPKPWCTVDELAQAIPCAPGILCKAMQSLQELGTVELSEDRRFVRLTAAGKDRLASYPSSRELITRYWKPPRR